VKLIVFVARLKTNRIVRILLKVGPYSFAGRYCGERRGEVAQEPLDVLIDVSGIIYRLGIMSKKRAQQMILG
jgi:hypothetical protein